MKTLNCREEVKKLKIALISLHLYLSHLEDDLAMEKLQDILCDSKVSQLSLTAEIKILNFVFIKIFFLFLKIKPFNKTMKSIIVCQKDTL